MRASLNKNIDDELITISEHRLRYAFLLTQFFYNVYDGTLSLITALVATWQAGTSRKVRVNQIT